MVRHCITRHHDAPTEEAPCPPPGGGGELQKRLEDASRCKLPPDAGITGPQYTYRIIQWGEGRFHILSRVTPQGGPDADRVDSEACHIVLSQDEIPELLQQHPTATPAGVMLALEDCAQWRTADGDKPPGELPIPGDNRQGTWEKLTGTPDSATLLYSEPYNSKCLLMIPAPTEARIALHLLHESDLLDPAHGWGHTFTTYGVKEDDIKETERIFIPTGSFLPVEDGWEDTPILCVNERLRVEAPHGGLPKAVPRKPGEPDRKRVHPQHPVPYHYEETPDSRMFNVPLRRISPLLRCGFIIFLLVLLAAAHFLASGAAKRRRYEADQALAAQTALQGKRHKARPVEKTAIYPGCQADGAQWELLVHGTAHATIVPLTGWQGSVKGQVAVVSERKNGLVFYVEGEGGSKHTVHSTWADKTLADVRCQGEPVAVLLRYTDKAVLLTPPIRIPLPGRPQTGLPHVAFHIAPADLTLHNGKLVCTKLPDAKLDAYVPWPVPPTFTLPTPPSCVHTITCHTEGGAPMEAEVRATKKKGGLQEFAVRIKLLNPMRTHVGEDFEGIVRKRYSQAAPGSTITHLYEIAKTFESGYKTRAMLEEYNNLRIVFMRHIILPPYDEDGGQTSEIIDALCDKINRELERCADLHRKEAEAYDKPLMLELRSVRYIDNGVAMHWDFALRPAEPTPPTK